MSEESPRKARGPKRKYYRFRLYAAARSLSLRDIARLSEEQARAEFRKFRFSANNGDPYCVHCGCTVCYEYSCRELFKCKACEKQFSLTARTIFNSRKMSFKDILYAAFFFINGVQGVAALKMAHDLGFSVKAVFVLLHKFRDAMADAQAENILTGEVEIDGVFIGGYVRQANMIADRRDIRAASAKKKRVIVTVRERRQGGRSRSFVVKSEPASIERIFEIVQPTARVFTDAADHWQRLIVPFQEALRVNHSLGHSIDGIHINGVEMAHLRIRRAEGGVYLSMNKAHAQSYAEEMSWRDDHRNVDNGRRYHLLLGRVAAMPASKTWVGYWRKRRPAESGVAA